MRTCDLADPAVRARQKWQSCDACRNQLSGPRSRRVQPAPDSDVGVSKHFAASRTGSEVLAGSGSLQPCPSYMKAMSAKYSLSIGPVGAWPWPRPSHFAGWPRASSPEFSFRTFASSEEALRVPVAAAASPPHGHGGSTDKQKEREGMRERGRKSESAG